MSKILSTIILGLFLGVFVLTLAAQPIFAQVFKPNDCCKIRANFRADIKVGNTNTRTQLQAGTHFVGELKNKSPHCDTNGDGIDDTTSLGANYIQAENWGLICMLNTIYTITNWLFYILTIIVVLMFIYGGFTILTAMGNPDKAGKGKGIITYAIIGLAVALLAKIIPSLVKFIMSV